MKVDKALLSRHLLGLGSEKPDLTAPDSESFIIDFMAYCRKVAMKKIKIQTY